jgi:hypothetical protein
VTLACIVLAHREPEQVAGLLSTLQHPRIRTYLHVDRRTPLSPFSRALEHARVRDAVLLPRYATPWGDAPLLDAILSGLSASVADGCRYFMLVSGQDFPLRPAHEIAEFAESSGSRSYFEHWPLATSIHRFEGRDRTAFYAYNVRGRRELCIPRGEDARHLGWKGRMLNEVLRLRSAFKPPRRFPAYVQAFAGATWWNLSLDAATYVLRFVDEHPDYRPYHTHTFAPDEVFFQSILAGTDFAARNEIVDDSLRFYAWEDMHARTLTANDLPALLSSDKLFARKFDPRLDSEVLARLAERVGA